MIQHCGYELVMGWIKLELWKKMTKTHELKRNKFEWDFPHKSIFRRFDFLSQGFFMASFPVSPTEDLLPPGFPNIDMGPQLKVVERTRTATMLCSASGKPDPEITWYKDFLPIDPNTSDGRIKQLRSGKESLCYDFLFYSFFCRRFRHFQHQ